MSRCSLITIKFLLLGLFFAPALLAYEPEPFRRDEVDGRPFDYGRFAFIDRYSYQFRPDWEDEWEANPQGFRVTGGSISSHKLYTKQALRKQIELIEGLFGEVRYDRHEDFYSRYYRFLMGMGYEFVSNWSFSLLGDVTPDKSDSDVYLELRWKDGKNNLFRFAYVLPDYFYNSKSENKQKYGRKPRTFFAEGRAALHEKLSVAGWLNINRPLELYGAEKNFKYDYRQVRGGGRVSLRVTEAARLLFNADSEGSRDSISHMNPAYVGIRDLERDHWAADAALAYTFPPKYQGWIGARYFFLDERDFRPNDPLNNGMMERNEYMLHSGLGWNISDKFSFVPALFFTWLDNREDYPGAKEKVGADKELLAKLNLTLDYKFSEKARGSFNPSWQLPGGPFGGFNVQFQAFF